MIRPNERVQRAIIGLEHDLNFKEFIDWLHAARESSRDDTEAAIDSLSIARCQGESRALTELLRQIRIARETLRKTG